MNRKPLATGLLFAALTIGYGIVHGVLAIWVMLLIGPFWQSAWMYESLNVTKNGEAFIQRNMQLPGSGISRTDRLDLKGRELPQTDRLENAISGRNISLWGDSHRTLSTPQSWQKCLIPLQDFGTPPMYWYLTAPLDNPRHVYLAAYDSQSRQLIGYMGAKGFSPKKPEPKDCLSVESRSQTYNFWNGIADSSFFPIEPYGYEITAYEPLHHSDALTKYANLEQNLLWILSSGNVYEINLLTKSLRILMPAPEALFLTHSITEQEGKQFWNLLLRTPKELRIIDPATLREIRLPVQAPQAEISCFYYSLANGEHALITQSNPSPENFGNPRHALIEWFTEDGKLTRTESCELAQIPENQPGNLALTFTLPVPTAPLIGLAIGPAAMAQDGDTRPYSARLSRMLELCGVWFVLSLLIGLACGWIVRLRELKIRHNKSWVWPITVGCLGWFGWIGYICLRPLPAKLPDGSRMPAHPEPNRLTGIEIFA